MYRQMSVTRQTGLTLLELVVSLLVMTILTSVAITSVSGIQEQARYEKTKERLEAIRKAILGDPGRTVNGQPMISGFVADMGRPPAYLRDLLQPAACMTALGYKPDPPWNCADPSETWTWFNTPCTDNTSTDEPSCTTAGGQWLGVRQDPKTNLNYGWRGPYLHVSGNPSNPDVLSDGWGNESSDGNYGWIYIPHPSNKSTPPPPLEVVTMQSLGRDGATGGTEEYDKDFPANQPFIARHDWIVDISAGIQINLNKYSTGGGNKDICLRIYYRDPNAGTPTIISDSSDKVTVNDSTLPTSIPFSPVDQYDIDNDGDSAEPLPYVPFGILAIGVYEFNSTVTPSCTTNPFPTGKSPQWVVLLPNTQPIINW